MTQGKRSASKGSKKAAKSSSAEKKPRKEGQRYNYTELSKASATSGDPHHFYAMVVDATFPYKTRQDHYICSLKIVDASVHAKGGKGEEYLTLVLFATRFEDLPIIQRVGDIIRVHRAAVRIYKGHKQFNANVYYKSSWVMFSAEKGDNEFDPLSFSGKNFTFEKHEKATLQNTRKWAQGYLSSNNVISNDMYTALNKAGSQKKDFDSVAKICQVFEKDEFTNELKIRDASNTTFFCQTLKLKFPNVRTGDVIRIRSAMNDDTASQKVLNLSHYSNIMTLPKDCKLAKDVRSKVNEDKSADKNALASKDTMWNPVILTTVESKHNNLPQTTLADLFHYADNDPALAKESTFRTTFSVVKVEPGNVSEWVKCYDKKTKKTTSCKGQNCSSKAGNCIYQVQLLCKDVSTQNNNSVYRVLVYTHEGLGSNFFGGNSADNLYNNKAAAKKLEDYEKQLTRFNAWVDAVVERRNGYYFIKDTKLAF